MTVGGGEPQEVSSADEAPPGERAVAISSRLTVLLIGGVALAGIVLMCLTVLLLVLLDQD